MLVLLVPSRPWMVVSVPGTMTMSLFSVSICEYIFDICLAPLSASCRWSNIRWVVNLVGLSIFLQPNGDVLIVVSCFVFSWRETSSRVQKCQNHNECYQGWEEKLDVLAPVSGSGRGAASGRIAAKSLRSLLIPDGLPLELLKSALVNCRPEPIAQNKKVC